MAVEKNGNIVRNFVYATSFHGEIWYRCPHCGNGIEARQIERYLKKVRKNVYLCDKCHKEAYYRN